jgi:hypothetical protein
MVNGADIPSPTVVKTTEIAHVSTCTATRPTTRRPESTWCSVIVFVLTRPTGTCTRPPSGR